MYIAHITSAYLVELFYFSFLKISSQFKHQLYCKNFTFFFVKDLLYKWVKMHRTTFMGLGLKIICAMFCKAMTKNFDFLISFSLFLKNLLVGLGFSMHRHEI